MRTETTLSMTRVASLIDIPPAHRAIARCGDQNARSGKQDQPITADACAVALRPVIRKSMLLPIAPLRRAIDWELDADFFGAGISFKNIGIADPQEERSSIS
ncbi:hypothetical protein [Sinorhizobium sp. GL28]|uniref:hypothetical protein n=1 Tax=Sinorhizobium sp. GL28 TaxID=1358418 RepID=UPI00072755D3|nr:hypothetical protein [Sinorhizobium sp. GL28]KSV94315.1 hypothetical protein N184_36690 [Sinorhizobium sp. GL28]